MQYHIIFFFLLSFATQAYAYKISTDHLIVPIPNEFEFQGIQDSTEVVFIKFKIRNNSPRIKSFYVKGPNGRGGSFSYGFKMIPYSERDENWSIGTVVYKQSHSGRLEELIVIKNSFEEKTINLFN